MKKLKLLSSLSALLLVLSVGACDKNTEDETSEEPTISELENYTLSVSFEADGTVAAIPEYGTAYIIGGWDSWGAFIPLKADDGKYVTTFDTIAVGTHEYKIVMWYTDQDVSWSDCIEITTTNQTLKVEASEGNDFTKEITHTLDVELPEPLTDEQIISGILEEASNYECADEIGWEAYHYTEIEEYWECEGEYYLTQDENENVYGSAYTSDEGDVTYSYFRGGSKYNYYPDEDPDDQYSKVEFNDTYTYAIEYFFEPFEILASYGEEDDGLDLDDYTVTVTKEITNYRYTLELTQMITSEVGEEGSSEYYYCETTYTYTYVCDTHFNLIAVGYEMDDDEEGLTSYFAESVTYEDVEASMSGFNPYQWDIAHSPAQLVEQAVLTGNYSVQVVVDEWISESISVSDQASGNYDEDALFDSMTGTEYVINAYYTEDALLIDFYLNFYGYLILIEEDLYVNTLLYGFIPCCDCYFTEDGETWYYYGSSVGYEWQDSFYSLFDNSWIGFEDSDFALLGSDVDSNGDAYDVYTFYSSTDMYYFGLFVGSDLWTSTWVNNFGYLSWFDYIYFYPELQMMCTSYYGAAWFYTDSTRQYVEIIEDDFYTTFYDVGNTEIDEELISYVEENAEDYE